MTGTVTAFNIGSVVLDSSFTAVGFIIEGLLGGNLVDTASESLNFASGRQTVSLGWANVDTVVFTDIGGSAGTLVLQQVNRTPVSASVPAPAIGLPVFLAVHGMLLGAKLLKRGKSRTLQFG